MGRRSGYLPRMGRRARAVHCIKFILELGETTPAAPAVRARAVDFPPCFSDQIPIAPLHFCSFLSAPAILPYSLSTSRGRGRNKHSSAPVRKGDIQDRGRDLTPTCPSHTAPFLGCGPVSRGPRTLLETAGRARGHPARRALPSSPSTV